MNNSPMEATIDRGDTTVRAFTALDGSHYWRKRRESDGGNAPSQWTRESPFGYSHDVDAAFDVGGLAVGKCARFYGLAADGTATLSVVSTPISVIQRANGTEQGDIRKRGSGAGAGGPGQRRCGTLGY